MNTKSKFVLYWVLLAIGVAGFSALGFSKLIQREMVDFHVLFSGAAAFSNQDNPYLRSDMREAIGFEPNQEIGMQLTLPGLFLVLKPIANLELHVAELFWASINLLSIFATIFLLKNLLNIQIKDSRFALLTCGALLLGPFHTALWLGNVDILALFFTVLAIYFGEKTALKTNLLAGIFLGLGMLLKINSTGLFAIYYLARRKFILGITSLSIWIFINTLAGAIINSNTPEWLSTWQHTIQSKENLYNKVSELNESVHQLIHLNAGFFGLFGETVITNFLSILICTSVFCFLLVKVWNSNTTYTDSNTLFTHLSITALVSLLIVYHKFYGAVFLVFPLAWAVLGLNKDVISARTFVLLLVVLGSIVNGQILYSILVQNDRVPSIINNSIVGLFLEFHFVWILLSLMMVLIWQLKRAANNQ